MSHCYLILELHTRQGLAGRRAWNPIDGIRFQSRQNALGTGQAVPFSTLSTQAGASDLASVELLFANSTTLSKACAVTYSSQQKTLGLTNDAGTGSAGSITPGQPGSVSNSQCTVSGIGSSIQSSGNSLIMTVNLQFKTTFASTGTSATKI